MTLLSMWKFSNIYNIDYWSRDRILLGHGWGLQTLPWSWSPLLQSAGSSPDNACLTNLDNIDSTPDSWSPKPSPNDLDETLADLESVSFVTSGCGARSRLPYDSINLSVSGELFGGKFDSAQLRFRFRFPPPQELEHVDHGSQLDQTPNLPSKKMF